MKFIRHDNKIFNISELRYVRLSAKTLRFEFRGNTPDEHDFFNLFFEEFTDEACMKIFDIVFESFCEFLEGNHPFFDMDEMKESAEIRVIYN